MIGHLENIISEIITCILYDIDNNTEKRSLLGNIQKYLEFILSEIKHYLASIFGKFYGQIIQNDELLLFQFLIQSYETNYNNIFIKNIISYSNDCEKMMKIFINKDLIGNIKIGPLVLIELFKYK